MSLPVVEREIEARITEVIRRDIPNGKLMKFEAITDRRSEEVACFIVHWYDGGQYATHLCYLREELAGSGLETGHYYLVGTHENAMTRSGEDYRARVARGY